MHPGPGYLFSEEEILAHRGLAYDGSDTLPAQFGDYADYVRNYAFPPPVPALSAPGLALLCAVMLASASAALRARVALSLPGVRVRERRERAPRGEARRRSC